MAHRRASLGIIPALLLSAASATAGPGKPLLLVRGVFRLSAAGARPTYDVNASGALRDLVATAMGNRAAVQLLDASVPACEADPTCYETSFQKEPAWAALEVDIAPGTHDAQGVERVPLKLRLFVNGPKSAQERLSEYETGQNCSERPSEREGRSECASFIATYLTDIWLSDHPPPACPAAPTPGRARKIGGGVAIVLGAGAVVFGGVLLGKGLEVRDTEGPCSDSAGRPSIFCQGYNRTQLGWGIGLLSLGVTGLLAGTTMVALPQASKNAEGTCRK